MNIPVFLTLHIATSNNIRLIEEEKKKKKKKEEEEKNRKNDK